ncbi:hypothetical protein QFZ77_003662 [Paenibacillus sp. V4I3]|uniref:copper amine oxidase N-terminal domain-containing protein n=1 Tax=Paenibacillus sp. V4I3 TaxID=3042305 RepID=UPI00278A72EA|nr:copper amine oxidase N-terminal domain-containing protein [Paenibacillus sp. V4I3]MDQ0875003.1 hypothetical protein [Paenibacillus sp. V4I3]
MLKRTITTLVLGATIFSVTPAQATTTQDLRMIPVIVNGQKVKFPDTEPYIDGNGRTLVPVRFVSEKLGGTVTWNEATQTVTIKNGSKAISLPIGSNVATVDGQAVTLDTTAVLTEGRTMVPLRFVSEALSSKVTWDDGGHAVQVSDSAYQAKVASGEMVLDAWGRELSKVWDAKWNKLTDMPSYVYDLQSWADTSNKAFMTKFPWVDKQHIDMWSTTIRNYYQAQLNVDYRTIDEDTFVATTMKSVEGDGYSRRQLEKTFRSYVSWVKKNHVIAKGYADPENSLVSYRSSGPVVLTHFKFFIIKADETAQTFMDNWDVSDQSDSFELETGVWYEGYSDVSLGSHFAKEREDHFGVIAGESMFVKGHYKYEILSSEK